MTGKTLYLGLSCACVVFLACGESSGPKTQLELSASAVELTYPGAQVTLTATVSNADGPQQGVILKLTSDRAGDDQIDPEVRQSAADGTAVFTVSSMISGSATLTLAAVELDVDPVTQVVDFEGPEISGSWSFPQPDGLVTNPRVGLVWVDFGYKLGDQIYYRELASQAIDPVPATGDQGDFGMVLPLQAARDDLYSPDPDDPNLPATFEIAPYAVAIYDDLDSSGDFSDGDALLGLPGDGIMLVYCEGELPDPQYIPNAAHGYQFMKMQADSDQPEIIEFDQHADQNDLEIRSAPCPSGALSGNISFGSGLPDGSDTRVAAIMVDADLAFGGAWNELYYHGNFFELASGAVQFAKDTDVAYQLDLPEPADVFPAYAGFLTDVYSQLPAVGLIVPIVYIDSDSDGAFTNDDDDLQTGDQIVGAADVPFGYDMPIIEWIDGIPLYLFSMMQPGVNQGYNLVRQPLSVGVEAVLDDNTLQVSQQVEPGHSGLKFKVTRRVGSDDQVIITGDDLSTGSTLGNTLSSAAGGFSGVVEVGDQVVIQNQIDDGQAVDFDTDYDLKTP